MQTGKALHFRNALLCWSALLFYLAASMPVKQNHCSSGVPAQCQCSNHTRGSVNVFCDRLNLQELPTLGLDVIPIHTYSLEGNNLTTIRTGNFFGLKISHLSLKRNQINALDLLAFWGLEYHLDNLDIGYNQLTAVPADALRLLRNLRTLNLEGNKISVLCNNDFSSLDRLEVLTLSRNPIVSIQNEAFRGTRLSLLSLDGIALRRGLQDIPTKDLKNLRSLSLVDNALQEIPSGWFRGLSSLVSLNLDSNNISVIEPSDLDGIHNTLVTLEINKNKLKKVPKRALRTLKVLDTLRMTHNRIRKIHIRSFNSSKKLTHLDISHNYITEVHPQAFVGMDALEKVDLRSNYLFTLEETTFHWENSKVKEVYMADNLWLCNCLLKWLKRDYKRDDDKIAIYKDLESLMCDRPMHLAGFLLVRLPTRDLTCDHDYYYYYFEGDYIDYDQ